MSEKANKNVEERIKNTEHIQNEYIQNNKAPDLFYNCFYCRISL